MVGNGDLAMCTAVDKEAIAMVRWWWRKLHMFKGNTWFNEPKDGCNQIRYEEKKMAVFHEKMTGMGGGHVWQWRYMIMEEEDESPPTLLCMVASGVGECGVRV